MNWTVDHVSRWLNWAQREFSFDPVDHSQFKLSGAQLCSLTQDEFERRAPPHTGDVLFSHLKLLQARGGKSITATISPKFELPPLKRAWQALRSNESSQLFFFACHIALRLYAYPHLQVPCLYFRTSFCPGIVLCTNRGVSPFGACHLADETLFVPCFVQGYRCSGTSFAPAACFTPTLFWNCISLTPPSIYPDALNRLKETVNGEGGISTPNFSMGWSPYVWPSSIADIHSLPSKCGTLNL